MPLLKPIPAPESLFAALEATEQYGLRKFPTPDQYHQLVARMVAVDGQPLSEMAVHAQRDWHVRGQTGCMFARLAALQAGTLRWDYVVVPCDVSDMAGITAQIDRAAADTAVEVVSLLTPSVRQPADAVALVTQLVDGTPFWLERDVEVDGVRRLHLRYPVGAEGIPAWVMAFGPLRCMPNTRRGPYFELAIRVKPKPESMFHRLNQDREVAHLADVPLKMTDKHWEDRWASTLRRTRMILGGEPTEVSAAKCTLAVPAQGEPCVERPC